MFGNAKLDVDLGIAKLLLADEIDSLRFGTIDKNALTSGAGESFGISGVDRNSFGGHPFAGGLAPGVEVGQIDSPLSGRARRNATQQWQQRKNGQSSQ